MNIYFLISLCKHNCVCVACAGVISFTIFMVNLSKVVLHVKHYKTCCAMAEPCCDVLIIYFIDDFTKKYC